MGWRQAALLVLLACPGCETAERFYSTKLPIDTPLDWWHQLQGGPIQDERPPPPGINDPYSNFGTIPPKPTPTDAIQRRALLAQLAGERDHAEVLAAHDPIITPQRAAPAPRSKPGTPTEEAPPPMARIDAADSPAPARTPPPPAAAPAPAAIAAAASPTRPPRPGVPTDAPPQAPVVAGPTPALPSAPPPLPSLPGIPAVTAAPVSARVAPQVTASFLPESAVLRPDSTAALRTLVTRRGNGPVAVLGGGDARSATPEAQAEALPLAWRRARAMQDVLLAAGVPASALRVDAAALARGGVVRLVE